MKIMTRFSIFITLFLVAFSLNAKPLPSLSMKMNWVDGLVYDQPAKILLEIMSQISTENMNVKLDLPAGAVLMEGQSSFLQKIEKGQPLRLEFTVFIEKNTAGKIEAEASVGNSQQVFFRAASQLLLANPMANPAASQKVGGRSNVSPAFEITERNGIKLREYKLP